MKRRAFTLIEVLVTIAIIGLLSTIAVVATSGLREKAAVASGLQFEASVQHLAGSEAVAVFDFEDGSGTSAMDASGNGNVATLYGGTTWICATTNKNYTPSGQGCALNLNGTGYVTTAISGVGDGTVSFWFNKLSGASNTLIGKRSPGCYSSAVYLNTPGNHLRVYNAGPEDAIGDIQYGKWNHLAIARSGSGTKASYYLNGHLTLTNSFNLNLNDLVSNIGSSCAGDGIPLIGYIDNLRVYGTAISASRIEKIYAEEKNKYLSLND